MEIIEGEVNADDLDSFLNELGDIEEGYEAVVQGFDARYLASQRHIISAVEKARRAFHQGENVAEELGMEIMLYVAGTRQIDVATEAGLKKGEQDAVFVVLGGDEGADERVRELVDEGEITYGDKEIIREFYDISSEELDAVGSDKLELLVLERVALLDINK